MCRMDCPSIAFTSSCSSVPRAAPLTQTPLLSPQALYGSIKNEKLQWAM